MARSQVGSLKSRINKVDKQIERKKLKKQKQQEKERLKKTLESKRKQLQKL